MVNGHGIAPAEHKSFTPHQHQNPPAVRSCSATRGAAFSPVAPRSRPAPPECATEIWLHSLANSVPGCPPWSRAAPGADTETRVARLTCCALACAIPFGIAGHAHAQGAIAGENLFRIDCSICHSPQPGRNLVGPSLFNVVNRRSGEVPNFHYSEANRNSGIT